MILENYCYNNEKRTLEILVHMKNHNVNFNLTAITIKMIILLQPPNSFAILLKFETMFSKTAPFLFLFLFFALKTVFSVWSSNLFPFFVFVIFSE